MLLLRVGQKSVFGFLVAKESHPHLAAFVPPGYAQRVISS